MSHDVFALVLWSMLGVDVVITIFALALRSWRLMLVAAALSVAFAVPAILSIGIFIFGVALTQILAAVLLHRYAQTT